jgi:hypothetical protein
MRQERVREGNLEERTAKKKYRESVKRRLRKNKKIVLQQQNRTAHFLNSCAFL